MEKSKKTYIETIGRRKTSTARVRMTPATKQSYEINDKDLATYFATTELQKIVTDAFTTLESKSHYAITVKVSGGGIHSQAEAIRHGISRGLVKEEEGTKTTLKKAGFLKRDPRMKERRKFGLKKARK
ncbi:MAG TPA: 30S ribosomal protein S9, partial [Candidatus Paceibacterota bacterium]|nr:30S ribosomal protein S9 [Candidatus Paceibacterota bacterium]